MRAAFLAVSLVASLPASAAQAVVLDVTFTQTSDNTKFNAPFGASSSLKGSHAFFAPSTLSPSNYVSPVDYRDGTFHVVIDVLAKPTATKMLTAACFLQGNYTCLGYANLTTPGRVHFSQAVPSFYQFSSVDWTKRFDSISIIQRDSNEKKLDLGEGFIGEPSYAAYYPLTMRVQIIAVEKGGTFVMPVDPPDAGLDAGSPRLDAGPADASVADAAVADAGGRDAGPRDAGVPGATDAAVEWPDAAVTLDAGLPETPPGPTGEVQPAADAAAVSPRPAMPGTSAPAPTGVSGFAEAEGGCASGPGAAAVVLACLVLSAARRASRRGRALGP
ncbi:MAG: hypothetical protein K1X89_08330 [Myxococcaceae bacterium]|nr:hypothetical protein [Myxococcaceae bacterium]